MPEISHNVRESTSPTDGTTLEGMRMLSSLIALLVSHFVDGTLAEPADLILLEQNTSSPCTRRV
jgi:hypothetical protein